MDILTQPPSEAGTLVLTLHATTEDCSLQGTLGVRVRNVSSPPCGSGSSVSLQSPAL